MRMLSSSSPVTAITMSARSIPARSSTHSSEPSPNCTECSSSSSTTAYRWVSDSMTVTSLPFWISSRARFQPTLPAPTIRTYTALPRHAFEANLPPDRGLEQLDGGLGGADGLEPLLGVPLRPRGIEYAHHHALHVEAAAGDLGDHEIGVVAVGGGHEGV